MTCPHCQCPATKRITNTLYRCWDCGTYFRIFETTTPEEDALAIDLATNIQPGEEWR